MRKLGVLLLLLIATAACVGRPPAEASGEEIYLQLCSNCHGSDLEGGIGPAMGPGSAAAAASDEFLRVSIHDGFGRMPSFSSSLDADQLDRLVVYLREVQGR